MVMNAPSCTSRPRRERSWIAAGGVSVTIGSCRVRPLAGGGLRFRGSQRRLHGANVLRGGSAAAADELQRRLL